MVELRSVLLLVGLLGASADRPVLPSELRNIKPSDAAKYVVAAKAAEGAVRARRAAGRRRCARCSAARRRARRGAAAGAAHAAARALVLLVVFLPVLLTALLAWPWPFFRNRVWFPMLTSALATAGAAFIKWGQWASCRPDIFPERLCAALSRLHSQAPTHGFGHTRREVEAACGAPLADAFEAFDPKPFASGSIAQLHRATLPGGRDVAVKVRHPAVVRRIVVDFALMRAAAEFSCLIGLRWLNLKASVAQFSTTMVAQTRLDIEAEHIRRFGWNFGGTAYRDVRFPEAILATRSVRAAAAQFVGAQFRRKFFCAIRRAILRRPSPCVQVLIESFEPGELVSKYTLQKALGMEGGDALRKDLAHFVVARGEDVYLKMLLVDNLMHADLHPGNILVHTPSGRPPVLSLIDLGMVARLTRDESQAFIGFIQAIGAGDGAAAARRVLKFSANQECATPLEFEADMVHFFRETCRGYGTNVAFGVVLKGVLGLVRKHRVTLDANYMTLVMNVLCLEGMAQALLPSYNVLDMARPLLDAHKLLPRPLFGVALPAVVALKRLRDRAFLWLDRTEG